MTKHECAVVMAYTGVVTLQGNDLSYFYNYAEKLMKRPLLTHELYVLCDELKELSRDDFMKLCSEAVAER